jgi:hypothetical protein
VNSARTIRFQAVFVCERPPTEGDAEDKKKGETGLAESNAGLSVALRAKREPVQIAAIEEQGHYAMTR